MNKLLTILITFLLQQLLLWPKVKVDIFLIRPRKQFNVRLYSKFKIPNLQISNLKKMNISLIIRIISFSLGLLFIVFPASLNAGDIDLSIKESNSSEIIEAPRQMSQKQMNDLFGEDPYLGQTSYLQSPDGFTQRDKKNN
jgi:hypothetical protein